ncbi:MAG TPA: phosphate ABC transporter permease subunit PstC [Candidatus Caldiarchaeum subterraneum]|uniref:Phosphate transport system permease protein n=1 Tax=Caldiarchaeum subterraneum TaxID=311458 RepID=A0A833ECD6_CALS0|nr:phosphate ABC transporter permease subunit PstC [Aigarchaeota archaeon]HIQ29690.1 phosphate ABC transporter permease subunit PstC [Candidatus Caldarchaeum subterraneum]
MQVPRAEKIVGSVLLAASLLTIIALILIIETLVYESLFFFSRVSIFEFLFGVEWTVLFLDKKFGVVPLLAGTFLTSSIAILLASTIGLGSAVYLSEYASPRVRSVVKPLLEILAGIPTVVYGYFAIYTITPLLKSSVFPDISFYNALSAGIAMGVMIIPTVASLSEDSLYAVPETLKHAAYSLGAKKIQVVFRVVIPAALSGIVASFILGLARAVGETMIVAIAAGFRPVLTLNPLEAIQTMTAFIAQVSTGEAPHGTVEYQSIFAVGLYLFTLVMLLNLIGNYVVRRWGVRVS